VTCTAVSAQTPSAAKRPAAATPRAAAKAPTAADIAAGKKLFASQCALCHGAEGAGGSGPTLRVRVLRRAADDAALLDVIREGISGTAMPAFGYALSDRSVHQVVAYVRSLGRIPTVRVPGDPVRGLTIYQRSECAACHTIGGAGGGVGPDLSAIGAARGPRSLRESLMDPGAEHPPGYLVATVTAGGAAPVRGIVADEDVFWIHLRDAAGQVHTIRKTEGTRVERDTKGSIMPSYASRFSEAELTDLVAYLSSLRGVR
jgi:putative heme-binding domain-containing protein